MNAFNYFKTFVLMLALLALMMFVGELVGGPRGMVTFFLIGLAMNFVSYWFSDKIVLAMYGAKEVGERDLPQVYAIVRKLTQKEGLPMPRLYVMDTPVPNAFATGRNPDHAAVCVTTGILGILDDREMEGVLGHELSHVRNRDILISTVAAAVAGAIMMISRSAMWFGYGFGGGDDRDDRPNGLVMIVLMVLAPIAALIIQMAISRSREYHADASGAELTGMPLALASALKKLQAGVRRNPMDASPATAHLFIVSPLTGQSLFTLFSTHPPIPERVKRLEDMAAHMGPGPGAPPKIVY